MSEQEVCFKSNLSWIVKKIEIFLKDLGIGSETPNALLMEL